MWKPLVAADQSVDEHNWFLSYESSSDYFLSYQYIVLFARAPVTLVGAKISLFAILSSKLVEHFLVAVLLNIPKLCQKVRYFFP